MIYFLYSIFDRVTAQYGEPFLSVNDATAQRKFNYLMSNAKMVANDCQLYKLAEYSSDSGELVSFNKPLFICNYMEVADV